MGLSYGLDQGLRFGLVSSVFHIRLECLFVAAGLCISYAYTYFVATNFKLSIYTNLEFAKRPEYIRKVRVSIYCFIM